MIKIIRFGISGGLSALIYFGVSWLAVSMLRWEVWQAGAAAYLAASPVAYLLHKHFTFSIPRKSESSFVRFICSSVLSLALSSAVPAFCTKYHLPLSFSLAVTCLLVPAFSYVLLSGWVFARVKVHG